MSLDTITIGNANTYFLRDFRNGITGQFENEVEAYMSICEAPPNASAWMVEDASNETPIVITSSGHGLQTGQQVAIVNVGDNRGAHGTFTVTRIDENHFSLDDSEGTDPYTTGGQFFRVVPDCGELPFDSLAVGQYDVTINGNIGLVNNRSYRAVIYCKGAFRDLFNRIYRITAKTAGS